MARFDARFDRLEQQIGALQLRIGGIDQRLTGRIDAMDERLSGRIAGLLQKIDRNFPWTTGINVLLWSTILIALVFRA